MSGNDVVKEGREFHFTQDDFVQVCRLIYDHAGIALSDTKKELVYSRLSRRLRATGITAFGEYLQLLESNNEAEWEAFTNSLTTNHFPLLVQQVRALQSRRPVALWCSAASTGEEPYSMAIALLDAMGSAAAQVSIVATDLDTNVLAMARTGVYPAERIAKLQPDMVKRYFQRGTDAQAGMVKMKQEVRDMVTFRQLNLLHDNWSVRAPLDAIFCRNVMIYFDKPTQLSILKKFVPLLRSDGLLYAGHSESFHHAEDFFKLRGKTIYELSSTARKAAIEFEQRKDSKNTR
jgi:chemotaxis protein methyltransferase CheR